MTRRGFLALLSAVPVAAGVGPGGLLPEPPEPEEDPCGV